MTSKQEIDQALADEFQWLSWDDILSWGVIKESLESAFSDDISDGEIRSGIQRLVSAEKIRLAVGEGPDVWENVPPEAPSFVILVDQFAVLAYLKSVKGHNGETHEHCLVLEPILRPSFEGKNLNKARKESIRRQDHVLYFREIQDENPSWICLLYNRDRCYVQSRFDEENPLTSPESALDSVLMRLDEEVALLQQTRDILTKAKASIASLEADDK